MDLTDRRVVELDVLSAERGERLTVALIPGIGPWSPNSEEAKIQLGGSFIDIGQVSLNSTYHATLRSVVRNPARFRFGLHATASIRCTNTCICIAKSARDDRDAVARNPPKAATAPNWDRRW